MKSLKILLSTVVFILIFLLLFAVQGDSRGDFGIFGNQVPSDTTWFPLVTAAIAGVGVWFVLGLRRKP